GALESRPLSVRAHRAGSVQRNAECRFRCGNRIQRCVGKIHGARRPAACVGSRAPGVTYPARVIISGAMHYFRVHPDQWRERLETLAAMGADSVETYVAWNLHEPRRGTFDFTGIADLGRFLDTA